MPNSVVVAQEALNLLGQVRVLFRQPSTRFTRSRKFLRQRRIANKKRIERLPVERR